MLNEDRVILMTKLASYEAHEGRQHRKIRNFFRGDYIAFQLLKAFFSVTVAYVLVLALYLLYNLEVFMEDIYQIDLIGFAREVLLYYLIAVAVYGVFTYIVCTYRYVRAKKSLKLYYKNLKKLGSMYSEG